MIVSNSTNHNYYINVCEAAANTSCANDTVRNIGVCQIDRNKYVTSLHLLFAFLNWQSFL